ncbi:MAG: hypothetical protein ACFFED_16780 [Candidatus Thorarchaeota archaeon]
MSPVDTDVSELSELPYYRDTRCEEVEDILRAGSKYSSCAVERLKQIDEFQEFGDLFDVQDENENHLVYLYEHEVDTLDNAELAVFAFVQEEREKASDGLVKWWGLGFILIILGMAGILTGLLLYAAFSFLAPIFPFWLFLSMLFQLAGGGIFLIQNQAMKNRRRDIDIIYASENASFLKALTKLASLSEATSKVSDSYKDRLLFVEEKIGMS